MRQLSLRAAALAATAVALCAFIGASEAFSGVVGGKSALNTARSPAAAAAAASSAPPPSQESALFSSSGRNRRRATRALQQQSSAPLLHMTASEESEEKTEEADVAPDASAAAEETSSSSSDVVKSSSSDDDTEKSKPGFVTALLLGPPLVIKFVIVLAVKFLTDLVVFPLLFLYRMARLAKNKVLGLFGVGGDDAGPNGEGGTASASS